MSDVIYTATVKESKISLDDRNPHYRTRVHYHIGDIKVNDDQIANSTFMLRGAHVDFIPEENEGVVPAFCFMTSSLNIFGQPYSKEERYIFKADSEEKAAFVLYRDRRIKILNAGLKDNGFPRLVAVINSLGKVDGLLKKSIEDSFN